MALPGAFIDHKDLTTSDVMKNFEVPAPPGRYNNLTLINHQQGLQFVVRASRRTADDGGMFLWKGGWDDVMLAMHWGVGSRVNFYRSNEPNKFFID